MQPWQTCDSHHAFPKHLQISWCCPEANGMGSDWLPERVVNLLNCKSFHTRFWIETWHGLLSVLLRCSDDLLYESSVNYFSNLFFRLIWQGTWDKPGQSLKQSLASKSEERCSCSNACIWPMKKEHRNQLADGNHLHLTRMSSRESMPNQKGWLVTKLLHTHTYLLRLRIHSFGHWGWNIFGQELFVSFKLLFILNLLWPPRTKSREPWDIAQRMVLV